MSHQFLTTREVADLLRITTSAVYSSRHRREPPGVLGIRTGRKILFAREDLDQWLESLRAETGAEA
jgi:excisionase family DNA binding protein